MERQNNTQQHVMIVLKLYAKSGFLLRTCLLSASSTIKQSNVWTASENRSVVMQCAIPSTASIVFEKDRLTLLVNALTNGALMRATNHLALWTSIRVELQALVQSLGIRLYCE
jgi:hypothetical protein